MPTTCCVPQCKNRATANANIQFYSFPKVNSRLRNEYQIILKKRRSAWFTAIRREEKVLHEIKTWRICSTHFISGKPSHFREMEDPDWVPSIKMGYESSSTGSKKRKYTRRLTEKENKPKQTEETVVYVKSEDLCIDDVRIPIDTSCDIKVDVKDEIHIPADTNCETKLHVNDENDYVKTDRIADVIERLRRENELSRTEKDSLKEEISKFNNLQREMKLKLNNLQRENDLLRTERNFLEEKISDLNNTIEELQWTNTSFQTIKKFKYGITRDGKTWIYSN